MKYIGNPVEVEAYKIVKVSGFIVPFGLDLELENGRHVTATEGMCARYTPVEGDYWVIQSDGYIYLNPKDVFERKYRPDLPAGTINSVGA